MFSALAELPIVPEINVDPYKVHVIASLASIHTKIEIMQRELLGNGQPGRVDKLESAVENLKTRQNYISGFTAAISFVLGVITNLLGKR